MHKLRKPWLALGWLWVGFVVWLTLTPHPPESFSFWSADKLEHVFAYCMLMLWFSQAWLGRLHRLFAAGSLVAMGCLLEVLQGMTGYRNFEYADMAANATGVVLGWVWARTALGRVGLALERKLFKTSKHD